MRWRCEALGVSRSGFHAWLTRPSSARVRSDNVAGAQVKASFAGSDRTYGARRVWHDVLAEGAARGLHRVERLMREQALQARPRCRSLPSDRGVRNEAADNVLDRKFEATAPNRKRIADFTYMDGRRLVVCGGCLRPVLAPCGRLVHKRHNGRPVGRAEQSVSSGCVSISRQQLKHDRGLIDHIVLYPRDEGAGFDVAILGWASRDRSFG